MARIEKTVFVSYRRATGSVWALAISQHLTHHGYDVFFDFAGLASGAFEQVIIENVRARAHFLVLLTPSALQRVREPEDWLRREVETAIESRRNIVPIMLEGFDFATPSISRNLTGTLAPLKAYNGLSVPIEYFDPAMERLRTTFLNVPVDTVLHPASAVAKAAASTAQRSAAESASPVTPDDLTAERWIERAVDTRDPAAKLDYINRAIDLNPSHAWAHVIRAEALARQGELHSARSSMDDAIRLDPAVPEFYNNRGALRIEIGDAAGGIGDLDEALRLRPAYASAFRNRADGRTLLGDFAGAIEDYEAILRLKGSDDPAICRCLDELRNGRAPQREPMAFVRRRKDASSPES
jgi:tetratricopeptide (TPR) repeat protein